MVERSMEILLVEDNPADVDLTIAALRDARVSNEIHIAHDGEEAIAFLTKQGDHRDAPIPDLVLLDLSLPRVDGHAVLDVLKHDPALRRVPVIVISSSSREVDISRAYEAQVAAYVVKPLQLEEYFSAIRSVKELWYHRVALPPKSDFAHGTH